ncbi:MAG: T9SS type A sorting domain-containing protein [Ferruginibacter sp.]
MTLFTRKPSQSPLWSILVFSLVISMNVNAGPRVVPGMPGPISGQTNVCAFVGTERTVTYTISPVSGAELYLWTVPPTANIVSGQGTTTIVLTFASGFTAAANKQLKVRAISQDGNSADRVLYLASQQPSTPNAINGPNNACVYIGTTNPATYSTAKDPTATGYIWGVDPASTYVSHPNPPGVNDTMIRVVFKKGYQTSPITVQAVNNCGFSAARQLNVAGSAPATPGIISGPTNGCPYMLPNGAVATYSINPVTGADSYTWITPTNCVITHPNGAGPTDVTITVQYPSDFTGGTISVIASSGCDDSSPRSLAISKQNPGTPGIIASTQKELCPDRQYQYSLPSMPSNAVSVTWAVPSEAIGFSGQGTTSIIVSYPEGHVNGVVSAKGVNNCATSANRQSTVVLSRCQNERMSGNTYNKGANNSNVQGGIRTGNPSAKEQGQQSITGSDAMKINIGPNPSKGNFKLQVTSPGKEIINIILLDLQGRELKKMNVAPGQSIIFGNELKPGTYLLEVNQGRTKLTQKILKL